MLASVHPRQVLVKPKGTIIIIPHERRFDRCGMLNELLSDIEQLALYYDLSGIDECGCTTHTLRRRDQATL
jgi:hypothetical protein